MKLGTRMKRLCTGDIGYVSIDTVDGKVFYAKAFRTSQCAVREVFQQLKDANASEDQWKDISEKANKLQTKPKFIGKASGIEEAMDKLESEVRKNNSAL